MTFEDNQGERDYKEDLKLIEEIRVRNEVFLNEFKKDLEEAGLV